MVRDELAELQAGGINTVLCTCSTLGSVAEACGRELDLAVTHIDRAMMNLALNCGFRILLIATLTSTLPPSRELLTSMAKDRDLPVEVKSHLIDGAWRHFVRGETRAYLRSVEITLENIDMQCFDACVLAQASMANIDQPYQALVPVFTPLETGLDAL
ncbi:MAG: aspartate/glutamate racemase family protein, partial [Pseudomonadota bacterium]